MATNSVPDVVFTVAEVVERLKVNPIRGHDQAVVPRRDVLRLEQGGPARDAQANER